MQPQRRILLFLVACVFLMPLSAGRAAAPQNPNPVDSYLAIVVNQANPVEDLSFSELRRIFLGERSHWANGRRITLVMMEPGTAERKAMLHDLYHMTEQELNRHFLRGLFTGEVFASPKTLASPVGVRKFVFNVPGAIGYIRFSEVDSSVKVIRVDGRLPEDKDYRLLIDPRPAK
jgi:ABC-type phosphate transport system substrate-binding protein